jgi:putative ABC transport system permease protein
MHSFFQDLRYGFRMLAKNPGFTAIAVLTLALGIGANTTIFSVVNAVLLQPLPYEQPERVMSLLGVDSRNNEHGRPFSYPDFVDYRKQNSTLEYVSGYTDGGDTLTAPGEPLHIHVESVSFDMFNLLRAKPLIGRTFVAAEDQPGMHVAILSYGLWKKRFGGEPQVTSKSMTIGGHVYTIVGVMPEAFQFPIDEEPRDLWTTMSGIQTSTGPDKPMSEERGAHFMSVLGRLKPGASIQQANADLATISAGLEKQYPDTDSHMGAEVMPHAQAMVGDIKPVLLMVLGAVAFLLLIACANTANLLLARAAGRQREMAIRASMGAGRSRILRQLLTESILLALAGGALGLLIAVWGTKLFANLSTIHIPRLRSTEVDWRVLVFTLGISVFTGVLFGLAPALHSLRFDLFHSLKEGGRNATEGIGHARLRSLLVVFEVSISVLLLIGASLLLESMVHLLHASPGFDPKGVLTFNIDLPDVQYGKPEQSIAFYKQLLERVRTVPGVKSASGVLPLPLANDIIRSTFEIEGKPVAKSDEPRTHFRSVGLDYFQTMRIPLVAGRDFNSRDERNSTQVVIINQALARKFFPNENPIGKHIKPGVSDEGPGKMREIVGVVGDVKHRALWNPPDPESYVPYAQTAIGQMYVVARTDGDPMSLLPAMREQVKAIDAQLPVYAPKTMDEYVASSIAQRKFTSLLCGVFAAVGLVLAVVGLFGVMSYTVSQRTHELGVRVAVGAEKTDILRLILDQGMRMTLLGIGVGLVGTFAITRVLSNQLFGISASDPLTFFGVAFLLALVALAACYIPARRATRVDPMVALRYE